MPKPKLYWDACIFYAWLNEETTHGPNVLDGIEEMARDFDQKNVILMTSVMTKTEVFDHKLKGPKARQRFTDFFKRRNAEVVAQDERVGDKSREIRDYYSRKKGITLDAGDSIHLATAILYKADKFYTLDGHTSKPKRNALLPLNGNVMGYPLPILVPFAQQGSVIPPGTPMITVSSGRKPGSLALVPPPNPKSKTP